MTYPIADVLTFEGGTLYWSHSQSFPREIAWRLPQPELQSSANWSGYLSTWTITHGKLWLTGVARLMNAKKGWSGEYQPIDLAPLFVSLESMDSGRGMIADWFTGTIQAWPMANARLWKDETARRFDVQAGNLGR